MPIATSLRLLAALVATSVLFASVAEFELWREHGAALNANAPPEEIMLRGRALAAAILGLGCGLPLLLLVVLYLRLSAILMRLSALASRIRAGLREDARPALAPSDEIAALEHAVCALQSTTRALGRSNAELEEFAYVVSHDLRSPLRAIQDLADWTVEDFGHDLPLEARRNLEQIRSRSDRLSRLLSELYAYARADAPTSHVGTLDLQVLAANFEELLGRNGQFSIRLRGLPIVRSAVAPIRIILMNLVSNAITHHDRASGRIVVETEDVGSGRITISVKDDGPGIEPIYQERIFGLFRTLRAHEAGATGFGLAYVRKLADRLDGSVTVISDPSTCRGAEFRLTVPGHLFAQVVTGPVALQTVSEREELADVAAA